MKKALLFFFILIGLTGPIYAVLIKNLTLQTVKFNILGIGKQNNRVIKKLTLPPNSTTAIPAKFFKKGKNYKAHYNGKEVIFDRFSSPIKIEQ